MRNALNGKNVCDKNVASRSCPAPSFGQPTTSTNHKMGIFAKWFDLFILSTHRQPTRPKYNPMPSGDERSDRILLNQRTTGHTLSEGGWSPFAPLLLNVGNSKSTAAVQVPKERPRYKRVAQARGLTTDDDDFCQPKGIRWTYTLEDEYRR